MTFFVKYEQKKPKIFIQDLRLKMSKKLQAFIALTKKVFLKKDKDSQLSLFDEKKDDPRKRYEIEVPMYAWKKK